MDIVLSSPEASHCPFRTYRESLTSFALAVYRLRLEDGRSSTAISNGSLFDPDRLYSTPRSGELLYSGEEARHGAEEQPYPAGIPSSYGMDFIEVQLSKNVQQALTVELHTDPAEAAEFDVQVIYLIERGSGMDGRMEQAAGFPLQRLERLLPGGPLSLVVPSVDLTRFNRLGVIITRVDGDEELDSVGAYTLVVK
jgi:hypothetical protein